jgi:hypothetical protein
MAPAPNKAAEQAARSAARPENPSTAPSPSKERERAAPSPSKVSQRAAPSPSQARKRAPGPAPRLTERGAVLIMAGSFLVGLLAAAWLGSGVPAGLAFVVGCVLAAWYTVPPGLLTVVVSPPLLFLGAVVLVNAMTGPGGLLYSVVLGSVVTLAGAAPWLAVGMILTLIIALARGLPRCIRDLYRELRSG